MNQNLKKELNYQWCLKQVHVGWATVEAEGLIIAPLDHLRLKIHTKNKKEKKLLKIEDSPQYKWAYAILNQKPDSEARQDYKNYVAIYNSKENVEYAVQKFNVMVSYYKEKPEELENTKIVTQLPKKTLFGFGPFTLKVYDGAHRSAIAKALGYKHLNAYLVKPKKGKC